MSIDTYDANAVPTGLEDIDESDTRIPRLKINHSNALFVDQLTKEEFPIAHAIVLGLVKQRIFWRDEVDEGDAPLCKSTDFEHGFPQNDPKFPASKQFPWERSVFNLEDYAPDPAFNNHVALPCASCSFKEWTKKSSGENEAPPCAEQYVFSMFYSTDENVEPYQPALLSVQRSGIKNARNYVSYFGAAKKPFFSIYTKVTLDHFKRGSVSYAVPVFAMGKPVDTDNYERFGDYARMIRDNIRQAPRAPAGDLSAPQSSNAVTAPPAKAVAAPAKVAGPTKLPPATKVQTAAPVAVKPVPQEEPSTEPVVATASEEDDLPF